MCLKIQSYLLLLRGLESVNIPSSSGLRGLESVNFENLGELWLHNRQKDRKLQPSDSRSIAWVHTVYVYV